MKFNIFKTKKRNWFDLVRVLDYGANNNLLIEIGTEIYGHIMEKLKTDKTDGVVLILDNVKKYGTIGLHSKFIPFRQSLLTNSEQELIRTIDK